MSPTHEGSGTTVEERAAVAEESTHGTQSIGGVERAGGAADEVSAARVSRPVPAAGASDMPAAGAETPGMADTEQIEREARGRLYQELDVLAFALEMEAAEALEKGDEAAAGRAQQTRLGIRLAQRLVGGIPAPEVDRRLDRWRSTYLAKFPY